MWLVDILVDVVGVGLAAQRRPQAALGAARLAELLGQLDQRIGLRHLGADLGVFGAFDAAAGLRSDRGQHGLIKAPAGQPDRLGQRLLVGEMREQRAQVGEALMEGQHVGIGRLGEVGADAVDDGVGHLVRDDVLRQAGEDALAGRLRPWPVLLAVK